VSVARISNLCCIIVDEGAGNVRIGFVNTKPLAQQVCNDLKLWTNEWTLCMRGELDVNLWRETSVRSA
jgi:hypothetical protein